MSRKQLTRLITAATLLALSFLAAATQIKGVSLADLSDRITALMIVALLAISYLLRLALPFLGVFDLYKMLRDRANDQVA